MEELWPSSNVSWTALSPRPLNADLADFLGMGMEVKLRICGKMQECAGNAMDYLYAQLGASYLDHSKLVLRAGIDAIDAAAPSSVSQVAT